MNHFYDRLIALTILGTFLWTTAMAIHNLYEIQTSLDRVEEILSAEGVMAIAD